MPDTFASFQTGLDSPGTSIFAITPSGSELTVCPRAIRANAAGSVTLTAVNDTSSVTVTMAAGEILPVRVKIVSAADMTVHGIV
jgi:hypothetical protein